MSSHVLISGATGFIAGHTIEALLAAGHRVTGTVRNPADEAATAHLRALAGAGERLRLIGADLRAPHAFDDAVADVDYVLHMASPYQLTVADPDRDLVQPAVRGTLAMLEACARSRSVRRVVVTSSMAAVTDEPDGSRVLTEADWNEKSSLARNPYYYSKVCAERAAWDFVARQRPAWSLVTINPFIVIGPAQTRAVNESNKIFVDLMAGAYPAIMPLTWGFVDVRDVAAAHVRALAAPDAEGRYLCAGATRSMRDVVTLLRAQGYGHTRLPKLSLESALGVKLAWLASWTQPSGVGTYLRSHLGRVPRYDTTKIRRDLGLAFLDVDTAILDTCRDLVRWGHVPAAP